VERAKDGKGMKRVEGKEGDRKGERREGNVIASLTLGG